MPPTAEVDSRTLREFQTRLLAWYAVNRRDLPWRNTVDPYAVLVSEVMLQQTQVQRVVPRFSAFLSSFPDLESLAAARTADVLALWSGLGYNTRAVRLQACSRALVQSTGLPARLPSSAAELELLPGIGPYTARAVLIFSANADLAAVDANVRRVLCFELGLDATLSPAALQAVADTALPRGHSRDWHNALMDYGSAVLTARATGIAPRARQSAFLHSRRWYRARLVRLLLEQDCRELHELAAALGTNPQECASLVELLEADGLVRRSGSAVRLA